MGNSIMFQADLTCSIILNTKLYRIVNIKMYKDDQDDGKIQEIMAFDK